MLQNLKWDDGVRRFIFQGALERAGQRCDEVTAMVMTEPGHWGVVCGAYKYAFIFDSNGDLVNAARLY